MTSIRAVGLGPLIGHTTDKTCRIWVRAGDPGDEGARLNASRRTVGVIGLVEGKWSSPRIGSAWYFRLQREFDRTGTFVLGADVQLGLYKTDLDDQRAKGIVLPRRLPANAKPQALKADTQYTVRVGTLTVDDPMPDDESLPDWELLKRLPDIEGIKQELLLLKPEESEGAVRTFPAPGVIAAKLSFLLGSCRYPGWSWKIKEADRIFGPMLTHFAPGNAYGDAARFTMMCGDQIYADEFNRMLPIGRADTFEEFQERYLTAFGAPNLHNLLRSTTTYMILDDHEIEDNWTQDRLGQQHGLFNLAIGAYQSYQWSHGPRTWRQLFYYTFDCAGYPAFVLDTRTQRYKDDQTGLPDNHLLGRPSLDPVNHPGQLQRLLEWLSAQQHERGNAFDAVNAQVAETFNRATKYVATHSPDTLTWKNTQWLGEDVVAAIEALKRQDGPVLLIQGSSGLIQQLLANDLIDELRLIVYPLVLGKGKRLFGEGAIPAAFKCTKFSAAPNGVIMANYERDGEIATGSFAMETPTEKEMERPKTLT